MKTISASAFKAQYGQKGVDMFTTPKSAGGYSFSEAGKDVAETGKAIWDTWQKAGNNIIKRANTYDLNVSATENAARNLTSATADLFGGIAGTVGNVVMGAGKVALPQSAENAAGDVAQKIGGFVMDTQVARDLTAKYNQLPPDQQQNINNVLNYIDGLTTIVTAKQATQILDDVLTKAKNSARNAISSVDDVARSAVSRGKSVVTGAVNNIDDTARASGAVQIAKEQVERIPRAINRGAEALQDAGTRAKTIKNSTPKVRESIKSGLDDRVIATVSQADDVTKKAYKEMLDIAETPQQTIRPKQQPSIVAGRAAETTYDILDNERKRIGAELGNAVKSLPPGTNVDMSISMRQLQSILSDNGITATKKGVKFAGKYTKAQRARIAELWDLVNELPEKITARQVRDMDNLLSQLQRETRMEGLQDILVEVNGQNKNMFQVFRDQYTKQLENIDPRIRDLNRQYRSSRTLLDDIEDTIFKTGKYESIKGADQAQFAKTNLRRIMGEAQSSPVYAEILARMDEQARKLGYTGARADDLIYFAEELRKLYPDTIPKTGFQGGIRNAIAHPIDTLTSIGAPDITDQQKALRQLLTGQQTTSVPATDLSTSARQGGSSPNNKARKVVDAITGKDIPNKEGGFIAVGGKMPDPVATAKKMDGKDFVILEMYADAIQNKRQVPISLSNEAESILDAMKVDTRNTNDTVEWIRTLLAKKEGGMTKLSVR